MASRRRLIVVSNRGPVAYDRSPAGERVTRRGAGGLVTALAPLVSRHEVTWVASAMSAEERALAERGPLEETAADGSRYRLRLVSVDHEAYRLYYDVVANPVLWFVQHGLWERILEPQADLTGPWRDGYVAVNRAFADAVVDELDRDPGAAVLFQDYHLYVAPRLVRDRRPAALLAHFVHIPWVGREGWRVLPAEIVRTIHDGLLASDTVGFHTERWRSAFLDSCEACLGVGAPRRPLVTVSPISVDADEFEALGASAEVRRRTPSLLPDRPERLVLRVDRTDPSKNATRGFEAFGRLLERRQDLRGRVAMLALLHPSRLSIPEYRAYADELQAAAAVVNAAHGTDDWEPITLDLRDDFLLSVAAYRDYDVLLVNPVLDGLNLVAKEAPLVNARDGVVVLSRGAGAFDELAPWVVPCDPLDVEGQAAALEAALELPLDTRRRWLASIRAHVEAHDLDAWAAAQLEALDRASTMRA
ncbi:MAG TPA: trehalose-6-phosphate synthase [Gaiellaceae bacterium]|nr:trehalose-6-phosphate synthase [Gaiellaceae bacterium]